MTEETTYRVRAVPGQLVPWHNDPKRYVGLRRERSDRAGLDPATVMHRVPAVLRDGKSPMGPTVDVVFVAEAEPAVVPATTYYHRAIARGELALVAAPAPAKER